MSVAFVTELLCDYINDGNTVFVASYDIAHLCDFADTITVLNKGSFSYFDENADFPTLKPLFAAKPPKKLAALKDDCKQIQIRF